MKTRDYVSGMRAMGQLAAVVRLAVSERGDWERTAQRVAAELRPRLPGPEILTAEQRYGDPLGYQCHLLHAEPDGSFCAVALVFRPGQETPVHDHVTWGVSGVLQGAEDEERFELGGDGWLARTGAARLGAGEVTGFAPPGDIHRVRNTGPEPTVSLHIYGTDVRRLGSSVRRVYRQPIVAG